MILLQDGHSIMRFLVVISVTLFFFACHHASPESLRVVVAASQYDAALPTNIYGEFVGGGTPLTDHVAQLDHGNPDTLERKSFVGIAKTEDPPRLRRCSLSSL